jgi:hypothetical protein
MFLTLLLQTAPSTAQSVPVAVYGTVGAALLAAAASLNAARISAKTARDSAKLAAQTAQELKEKDYKNDFYKKLIEKRLAAWAEAEEFIKPLARVTRYEVDGEPRFTYFSSPDSFWKVVDGANSLILLQFIWIGGNFARHSIAFRQKLLDIANESGIPGHYGADGLVMLDSNKLWESGKNHHQELLQLYIGMVSTLGTQLATLHDIETFLRNVALVP